MKFMKKDGKTLKEVDALRGKDERLGFGEKDRKII